MSQNDVLQVFISKLQKLRRGDTVFGKAPHKSVLLLSVIFKKYILCEWGVAYQIPPSVKVVNPYGLKALEGTKLYLPMPEVHFPRVENFLWHLGARFEK